MNEYKQAIVEEMEILAKLPKTLFIGQQTASEDFYNTLKTIPLEKRYEMPVAEELQIGLCIGLAMEGWLPISIYQRIDFLPRAMDQLVNHLNIIPKMSRNRFNPKIIIRTTIGTKNPFDVGEQHSQDHTELFRNCLNFPVRKVTSAEQVHEAYSLARNIESPILIIEEQELY